MRHKNFGRKLNRDVKERKALFRSLIRSLILYGKIKTTIAKGKAIKRIVDKLVMRAKDNSITAARQVASFLTQKELIEKLTKDIAPRFQDRIGGFLRMYRAGKRVGDNTEEVVLEWTVAEKKPVAVEKEKKEKKERKGTAV